MADHGIIVQGKEILDDTPISNSTGRQHVEAVLVLVSQRGCGQNSTRLYTIFNNIVSTTQSLSSDQSCASRYAFTFNTGRHHGLYLASLPGFVKSTMYAPTSVLRPISSKSSTSESSRGPGSLVSSAGALQCVSSPCNAASC